jgi:hypothetical protein
MGGRSRLATTAKLTKSTANRSPAIVPPLAGALSRLTLMDDMVAHIFWDQSNIFHCAQAACDDHGMGQEPGHRYDLRLNFQAMYDFASMGRTIEKAIAVGSVPPDMEALWRQLEHSGVSVELWERGAESGKEQSVDEAIQLHMMRSLADRIGAPAVAVVLTGDGGFKQDIGRLLDAGWGVEVLSFSSGFSHALQTIGTGHGGRGKYVTLDPWYKQLTYLQDTSGRILRASNPLDTTGRFRV